MNTPMISVVIPVYNVEPYLEFCVKSVQEQTFKEIEIILVDDGSIDKSGELCDRFAAQDARVQVIHQKNQGLAAARNAGVRLAKGKYLAFLDSDDYWQRPQALQEMADLIHNSKNEVDVVLFPYTKHNLKTGRKKDYQISPFNKNSTDIYHQKLELLRRRQYCNSACTKLVRSMFLKENQIVFPVGRKSEDLVWSREVLTESQILLVYKKPIVVYQINRAGSIVSTFGTKNYNDILEQIEQDSVLLKNTEKSKQRLGYAYWAEQVCWFLAYFPQSGKPFRETILENKLSFELLKYGESKRAKIIKWTVRVFGKTLTVKLLSCYLSMKR